MNFRRAGIVAGILCITLLVAWLIFGKEEKVVLPLPIDEATETESAPKENVAKKIDEQTFSEKTEQYVIDVKYPITESASVNAYIREFVDDAIAQYKKDIAWTQEGEVQSQVLSFNIIYKTVSTEKAENFIFTIGTYTGGAHGLYALKVIRFTPEGKPIYENGIFKNTSEALKLKAPFVQKELEKREFANKEWIADGAAPKIDNYKNIVITDTGITVMFEPYSVAPYAAGVQEVDVPLWVFEKVANMDLFTKE